MRTLIQKQIQLQRGTKNNNISFGYAEAVSVVSWMLNTNTNIKTNSKLALFVLGLQTVCLF